MKLGVQAALWRAVDRLDYVLSATLAGSFATGTGLDGFSDIDTIIITDELDAERFACIQQVFREELAPVLTAHGWELRINATLGPLKFNDERTAVLHLMLYSKAGHRNHVVKSPFTCLDWQRSPIWRTRPMTEVYPVFSLQPRHFFSARRSAKDYLADLNAGLVSYRELHFEGGYHEVKLGKQMEVRDRHEFAYHILRFLMQNALKLVRRVNEVSEGETLVADIAGVFPDGMDTFGPLYLRLARMKKEMDFSTPVEDLIGRISAFVAAFEAQFRDEFEGRALRQAWVRHAPTAMNRGEGLGAVLQGRSDPPILDIAADAVAPAHAAWEALGRPEAWSSPLSRAVATARAVTGVDPKTDAALLEIDYGSCEGLTASEATAAHPELAAGWRAGTDPAFPGGENSAAVLARARAFLTRQDRPALVATHNVVLREVLGDLMSVPRAQRHRLRIPYLTPITLVRSPRFGWFANLEETVETACFAGFYDSNRKDAL